MKTIWISIIILFSANAVVLADYTIVERMEHNGAPAQDLTIHLKGGKARCDMGPGMSSIVNGNEVTILMHKDKTVLKMPMNMLSFDSNSTDDNAPAATLTPTGRKQTINGYETEEYVNDNPQLKAKTHLWIAKNFPDSAEIMKMIKAFETPMTKQLIQGAGALPAEKYPGLPIRTEIESNRMGRPSKTVVEVISIKKESVDDSMFIVPADYHSATAGE